MLNFEMVQEWWREIAHKELACEGRNDWHWPIVAGAIYLTNREGRVLCPFCADKEEGTRDPIAEVGYDREIEAYLLFMSEGGYMHLPDEYTARQRQFDINYENNCELYDAAQETGGDRHGAALDRCIWHRVRSILATHTCSLRRKPHAGEARPWRGEE